MCFTDSGYFTNEEVAELGKCILEVYNEFTEAHFMWTAHNEIEAKWDYIKAYDLGWINQTTLHDDSGHWKKTDYKLNFLQ